MGGLEKLEGRERERERRLKRGCTWFRGKEREREKREGVHGLRENIGKLGLVRLRLKWAG